jgi:hypothetical protein
MEFKNKTGLKNIETAVKLQINSFKSRKNKNKTSAYEINDFKIDTTYIKQFVIQDNFTYSFKIIPSIIKRNSFFNLTVFRKNGVWETSAIEMIPTDQNYKDLIMKKHLIIFLTSLLFISCKAQNIIYKKIESNELNSFIGKIIEYKKFDLSQYQVKTIITTNIPGSAGNPESDEVSHNIYISICEYEEYLDCKLYLVENLIKINVESIIEDKANLFIVISSGNFNERKTDRIVISK